MKTHGVVLLSVALNIIETKIKFLKINSRISRTFGNYFEIIISEKVSYSIRNIIMI